MTLATLVMLLFTACERPVVSGDAPDSWNPTERPTLQVTLQDESSGSPLGDAWVVLDPSGRDARTDEAGVATFYALEPGTYRVEGAAMGYELDDAEVTVEATDATLSIPMEAQEAR